jgi:hypothetical protein
MTAITISAKRSTDAASTEVTYDLGDNLTEMVAKFGEAIVYAKARQSIIVDAQVVIRHELTETAKHPALDQGALQDFMNTWKPEGRKPKATAAEKAQASIAQMTPEERKALLKKLKAEGLV